MCENEVINQVIDYFQSNATLGIDQLNSIESFVLFSRENDLKYQSESLISTLIDFINANISEEDANSEETLKAFQILRFFRLNCLNPEQTVKIEDFSLNVLLNFSGEIRFYAFSLLVDYFTLVKSTDLSYLQRLFDFCKKFIQNCEHENTEFASLVITNLGLFEASTKVTQISELYPIIFQKVKFLLSLAYDPSFFSGSELLTRKLLKCIASFFSNSKLNSPEIYAEYAPQIIDIGNMIPNNIKFARMYIFFLNILSTILDKLPPQISAESIINTTLRSSIIQNYPLFTFPPLSKSRRLNISTGFLNNFIVRKEMKDEELVKCCWPLFSTPHVIPYYLQYSFSVLQAHYTSKKSLENPSFSYNFIEQICACLRILIYDFESHQAPELQDEFETEIWAESMLVYMKSFQYIIQNEQPKEPNSRFLSYLRKFTEFVAFLLDLICAVSNGPSPEVTIPESFLKIIGKTDIQGKLYPIIQRFIKTIGLLNYETKSLYLMQNLEILMPKKSYQKLFKNINTFLLQNTQPQILYEIAFFSLINRKFDELFSNPLPMLLNLVASIFKEIFSTDDKVQMLQSAPESTFLDISSFIWKIFASKNAQLIELLLSLFNLLFPMNNIEGRLPKFIEQVKSTPFMLLNIFRVLCETKDLKEFTGLLALFSFQLCQKNNADQADMWTSLFLYALESNNNLFEAVRYLFYDLSKMFPYWISKIQPTFRMKLISSLTESLRKLPQSQILYSKSLLARIPEQTSSMCMTVQDTRRKKTIVEIDGFEVYPSDILEVYEKQGKDVDTELLIKIFNALRTSLKQCDVLQNQDFQNILEKLHKLNDSFIADLCNTVESQEELYSLLLINTKYTGNVDISRVENKTEFCDFCSMFCSNMNFSKAAILNIKKVIKEIPVSQIYVKTCASLVSAAFCEYEEAKDAITESIFTAEWNTANDDVKLIINGIMQRVFNSTASTLKKQRKLASYLVDFFEKIQPINRRNNIDQTLLQIHNQFSVNKMRVQYLERFDSVLQRDFTKIVNPVDICIKYSQAIQEMKVADFPEPVEKMMINNLNYEESVKITNLKFCLKIIARLLPMTFVQTKSFNIFEMVINIVKKMPKFIPFFIKQLKKQDQTKLPKELSSYVSIQAGGLPEIPAKYNDALLVELAVTVNGFIRINEVIDWCTKSITSFATSKSLGFDERKTINVLLRIIKFIIADDMKDTIRPFINETIRCAAIAKRTPFGLESFPIQEACKSYPLLITDCFINILKQRWSFRIFFLMLDLIKDPELSLLRNNAILLLYRKIDDAISFIQRTGNDVFNYIVSSSLSEFSMNFAKYETVDISKCIFIITRLLPLLDYYPSQYFSIITILFSPQHAKKYVRGSELFNNFIYDLLTTLVHSSHYFFQPIFLTVFTEFLKNLPEDVWDDTHNRIVSFSAMSTNEKEKAFILALCNCSCNAFNKRAESITCDLSNASRDLSSLVCLHFAYKLNAKGMYLTDPFYMENASSIAHSITCGTGSYSQITDLKRIVYAVRLIPSNAGLQVGLVEAICRQLPHTPFTATMTKFLYRLIEYKTETIDLTYKEIAKYIIVLVRTCILQKGKMQGKSDIYRIPQMLKLVSCDDNPLWNDAALEILINETAAFFKANETIANFTFFVREMRPYIERRSPTIDVTSTLELIRKKVFDPIPDRMSGNEFSVMLKIIADLGKLIIKRDDPIPPVFTPSKTMVPYIKRDQLQLFKEALETIDKTVGITISKKLINAYYTELKTVLSDCLSPPKEYPFATAAKWLSECKKSVLYHNIKTLFEALAPHNFNDFADSINSMTDSFIPEVLTYIRKVFKERFNEKYAEYAKKNPKTLFFFAKKSEKLVNDLWNQRWLDVSESYHLRLFARMAFPEWYGDLLDYVPEETIQRSVSIAVLKGKEIKGFNRWCSYYTRLNIKSKLNDALWSACFFNHANPIPYGSLFENRKYLNLLNLCEDSLGLVKTEIPELFNAATYHQLSNYEAAKNEYIGSMAEHEDSYFFALLELKQVSSNINLIKASAPKQEQQNQQQQKSNIYDEVFKVLPSVDNTKPPAIFLPFFMNYSTSPEIKAIVAHVCNTSYFTTFLSQTYLPYLTRCALSEEVYKNLQVLHNRNTTPNASMSELVSPWKVTWMNAFDKLSSTISTICWRLTIINKMMKQQPSMDSALALQDVSKTIHLKLACLLQKAGAIKEAIMQLKYSDTTGGSFKVDIASFGRVHKFLATADPNEFQRIRYREFLALHDFRSILTWKQFPDHWISCMFELYNEFPSCINDQKLIDFLSNQFKKVNNEKCDKYILLLIGLIKKHPKVIPYVDEKIFGPQQTDEMKKQWLRWLPLILKYAGPRSQEFINLLALKHGMHFVMSLKTLETWGPEGKKIYEQMMQMMNSFKIRCRALIDFHETFGWIEKCREDIKRLDLSVKANQTLLKMMDDDNLIIDDDLAEAAGGRTFEDIAKFCEANPPYFTSKVRNLDFFSTNGIKFSYVNKPILSVSLNASGKEEATLRLLQNNGESLYVNIISSKIYQFSFNQIMFYTLIKKHIQTHMSNIPRAEFLPFSFSFSIDPSLLIVYAISITTLPMSLKQNIVEQLRMQKQIPFDGTPRSRLERKNLISKDQINEVRKTFIKGTEGHFVDFLMMRQLFASSLAFSCAINVIFKRNLPLIPNFSLGSNGRCIFLHGFLQKEKDNESPVSIPLTESILHLIPRFVLNGSFTTTFLSTSDSLHRIMRKFRVILSVLMDGFEGCGVEDTEEVCKRIETLTPAVSQDTEKTCQEFPFAVVDHLISEASNRNASFNSYAWI